MLGGNVCRAHGGAAPQTRAKAQRRLQQAADVLVQRLLSFALDGNAPDAVALQAIRDALDRAGLKPGVEVGMTVKPYESILEQIESGSRAEFRRSRGVADDTEHPPALADTPRELTTADADAPIDAEIVGPGSASPDAAGTPTTTRWWAPNTAPPAHGGSWSFPHAPAICGAPGRDRRCAVSTTPPDAAPHRRPARASPGYGSAPRRPRRAVAAIRPRWGSTATSPPAQPNGTLVARDQATPQSHYSLQDRLFLAGQARSHIKAQCHTKFSTKSRLALLRARWELVRLACHDTDRWRSHST
jgi:hypothetical protein